MSARESTDLLAPHIVETPSEMVSLGKRLASILSAGDRILLYGDLGSGKTTLTKGIVSGKGGAEDDVISPSFSIMNIYDTNPKIYHIDLYRIDRDSDADFLDDYIGDKTAITIIEWPKGRFEAVSPTYIIKISFLDKEKRKIDISPGSSTG